ncbi:MAG TPA: hypothetical protein VHP99_01860 [Pyrinomonadaceae bacterium]|jgi:hypothetical protein|nr:hypothetical protein [Pyrinomonadaceae bacterium]
MSTLDIVVTDLTFPEKLEDKYCKFRPLISVRYRTPDGKISYAREALPGLGSRDYWECERDNKNKDNYVRHATLPKIDIDKVDISKREIIFNDLDVKKLERIEIELFDIDIKVGWEKGVQIALQMIPESALTFINPALPVTLSAIKSAVEQGTGKKVEDLEKGLISKAIGKDDGAARSIWVRSQELPDPPPQTLTLSGPGTEGVYSMSLTLDVS